MRVPQNLGRRARLDDDTLIHEDDLIADLAGKPQLVGNHDHGHTSFRKGLHHVQYLTDEFRVERGGRLVEEQQLGLHRQGAGNRDPLLLPPGQLPRVCLTSVPQSDTIEQHVCLRRHLVAGSAENVDRGFDDVLEHGHVRKQVEALEHHAGIQSRPCRLAGLHLVKPAITFRVADQLLIHVQAARINLLEVIDAAQEGRLPGSGRSDEAGHRATLDAEVDALEDLGGTESLPDSLCFHHDGVHFALPSANRRRAGVTAAVKPRA